MRSKITLYLLCGIILLTNHNLQAQLSHPSAETTAKAKELEKYFPDQISSKEASTLFSDLYNLIATELKNEIINDEIKNDPSQQIADEDFYAYFSTDKSFKTFKRNLKPKRKIKKLDKYEKVILLISVQIRFAWQTEIRFHEKNFDKSYEKRKKETREYMIEIVKSLGINLGRNN